MSLTVPLHSHDEERTLLGERDSHARAIRNRFGVVLTVRKGRVVVDGDEADTADAMVVIKRVLDHIRTHGEIDDLVFERMLDEGRATTPVAPVDDGQLQGGGRGQLLPAGVVAKTRGQDQYIRTMQRETITFAIGPAGTGKTYLAAAVAIGALKAGTFRKLVLVRPAVEAGEHLGFLPGDFVAKINPYLRPLYDALSGHLEPGKLQHFLESDVIEIAPLAYMRGRTLDNAFIILDEAQNTTGGQMKMFLTRMGMHSKVVVTGDETQVDLPRNQSSGLAQAVRLLRNVSGIGVVRLDRKDIVRHPLVQKIVSAYEQMERNDDDRSDGR
ncbi:MAG: PhoH family protein [Planctomycetes bacterium]|nr:PhoH family protein [Planctomycetota bacterium]